MNYIFNDSEVPEEVYNFCSECLRKNPKFVILKNLSSTKVGLYMDNHPEYDYYINFS